MSPRYRSMSPSRLIDESARPIDESARLIDDSAQLPSNYGMADGWKELPSRD